jgi:hypothetical protein
MHLPNKESLPWQSQRIRLASIIIKQRLTITLPLITIIKQLTIMIWASMKMLKNTPRQLTNIAKPATNTRRPRVIIPGNEVREEVLRAVSAESALSALIE